MAKKTKSNALAAPAPMDKYEPTTRICVSKPLAGQVSVGDKVTMTVSGEVVGIQKRFDDDSKFDVEIKGAKVEGVQGNQADKALKEMSRK